MSRDPECPILSLNVSCPVSSLNVSCPDLSCIESKRLVSWGVFGCLVSIINVSYLGVSFREYVSCPGVFCLKSKSHVSCSGWVSRLQSKILLSLSVLSTVWNSPVLECPVYSLKFSCPGVSCLQSKILLS